MAKTATRLVEAMDFRTILPDLRLDVGGMIDARRIALVATGINRPQPFGRGRAQLMKPLGLRRINRNTDVIAARIG